MGETPLKLREIATRIQAHLAHIERSQPKDAAPKDGGFYFANAWVAGSRVGVRYVSYQISTFLTKADAIEYLAWLDAGNQGRHYNALSFNARLGKSANG